MLVVCIQYSDGVYAHKPASLSEAFGGLHFRGR